MDWMFVCSLQIHTSFVKLLLLCQILISLLSFIYLISIPVNRFISEQSKLSSVSFSRGEEKIGQLYRKHFTSLLECISHPYFGIPGQSVLALFISIYAFNGFSVANYAQTMNQKTFYRYMI